MIEIAPSLLSSTNRIEDIKKLNNTDCKFIHIDVMDNKFVQNYQMPVDEVIELSKYSNKRFDVHLMVENPEEYINSLNINNIYNITFHIEIDKDINKLIDLVKKKGLSVGLAIKLDTPLNKLDEYLDKVDMILIMSIAPGFGGQKFDERAIERIKQIRKKKSDILIEVDGGINIDTIDKIKYFVDIAVAGSYITNSNDFGEAINNLKN